MKLSYKQLKERICRMSELGAIKTHIDPISDMVEWVISFDGFKIVGTWNDYTHTIIEDNTEIHDSNGYVGTYNKEMGLILKQVIAFINTQSSEEMENERRSKKLFTRDTVLMKLKNWGIKNNINVKIDYDLLFRDDAGQNAIVTIRQDNWSMKQTFEDNEEYIISEDTIFMNYTTKNANTKEQYKQYVKDYKEMRKSIVEHFHAKQSGSIISLPEAGFQKIWNYNGKLNDCTILHKLLVNLDHNVTFYTMDFKDKVGEKLRMAIDPIFMVDDDACFTTLLLDDWIVKTFLIPDARYSKTEHLELYNFAYSMINKIYTGG